jgi:hypothetical protein
MKLQRATLLEFLNREITVEGHVKQIDNNFLLGNCDTPRVCLTGVRINNNGKTLTHLWVKGQNLHLVNKESLIRCKGEVYMYKKHDHFISFSLKNARLVELVKA